MAQFSMEIMRLTGSVPRGNQQLSSVRDAVEAIKDIGKVSPPGRQPSVSPANDDGHDKTLDEFLNGPPRLPGKQSMAPAQGPVKGEVVVKSEVKVAVDGGRVVSQTTQAPVSVPVSTNTGRAIGSV